MRGKKEKVVKRYFDIVKKILSKEDKYLRRMAEKLDYDPEDFYGGISELDEKHLQYIIFRNLLKMTDIKVYMEDPYGKKKCDLTLYDRNYSLWIEMKAVGWDDSWERKEVNKRWINSDVKKLKGIKKKKNHKYGYLLLTWIMSRKPNMLIWKNWFNTNLKGVRFNPSLFSHFRTSLRDKDRNGYSIVCLLEVI
jgi:hypothetical protein